MNELGAKHFRSIADANITTLTITIPAKKNYSAIAFLTLWIVIWALGEFLCIAELGNPDSEESGLFLTVWLVAWTLVGVFVIYVLLWMLAGREIIIVSNGQLQHIRQLLVLRRRKCYALANVSDWRVQDQPQSIVFFFTGVQFQNLWGGAIVFNCRNKVGEFGNELAYDEASYLLDLIRDYS